MTPVSDVILALGSIEALDGPLPRHLSEPVQLSASMWIGPIADSAAVRDACEPAAYRDRQVGQLVPCLYGLWCDRPAGDSDPHNFDSDQTLQTALALSRLVRPTSISLKYSARRIVHVNGIDYYPHNPFGPGSGAFVLDEASDYLDDLAVAETRALLAAFAPSTLPARVRRALWYHEYLCWNSLVDIRWPLAVTALEALVHTDRARSTDQFARRLAALVTHIPGLVWTESDLRDIYDARSGLVHGAETRIDLLTGPQRSLIEVTEQGLRTIVLAAIREPAVGSMFQDEASIKAWGAI